MTPKQWRAGRGPEDCWACGHSKYLSDRTQDLLAKLDGEDG